MNDIAVKNNMLDKNLQQEVNDFIDFLLNKQHEMEKPDLSEYKKRVLKVSTLSEEDIAVFNENSK
jgi:ubiquitin C-terminal hydrolase